MIPLITNLPSRTQSQANFDASVEELFPQLNALVAAINALPMVSITGALNGVPIGNVTPSSAVFNSLKLEIGAFLQNYSGLTRSLTPLAGAILREYVDVANAATVGGFEHALVYNCAIDAATGIWAGRDVAGICWLEKWHSTAGTKEIWFAPTAAAGVVPAWVSMFNFNATNGSMVIGGTMTVAPATAAAHAIQLAQAQTLAPVGHLIMWAGSAAPAGFLQCPTAATNVSRTTYSALFAAIGTTWGVGDGNTTFGIPWFAAGYAAVHGITGIGSLTHGAVIAHNHTTGAAFVAGGAYGVAAGTNTTTSATGTTGGADNLAAGNVVMICIKY